jgi:hypothetical protein
MKFNNMFQKALDTMKNGIVNITKDMQSEEKVKTIKIRKSNNMNVSTVTINGSHIFQTSNCIQINIEGDVHSVDSQGSVTCENVTGDVNTQGSVTCHDVGGEVDTQGSVRCENVKGSISTMGSVRANDVYGDIDTMGTVTVNRRKQHGMS